MAYTIIYAVLVIYTVMFLFQYLKRLIYIIFLTIIAPLVALTYPIDKMNDGSAQAFNMWLKEYIYNLLIQPFHLILYCVLIGSAVELASTHLIYTLAVLGFMLPAEKILRKFFGFDTKGGTGASIMSGAVGGAMVMNAIGKIGGMVKGGTKKGTSGNSGKGDGQERIRMSDRTSDSATDDEAFLREALGGKQNNEETSQQERQRQNNSFDRQEEMDALGEELGNKNGYDLSGYRKMYACKKHIRIVYSVFENILLVNIIAIGKREDMEVYETASERI